MKTSLVGAALLAGALASCSLLVEGGRCTSDGDCASVGLGYVCSSGACVRSAVAQDGAPVDSGAAEASAAEASAAEASAADGAVPADAGADGTVARSDDFTVSIGVGYATGCALSSKGRVKCWGDTYEGELLGPPVAGKQCYAYRDDGFIDCDPRGVTELAIPDPVVELSVGYLNVCVIANHAGTNRLGCWGKNDRYGLTSAAPISDIVTSILWVPLPAEPKHVIQGRNFKLVSLADGSIWAWGDNRYGQYGGLLLESNGMPQRVFPPPGTDAGAAPTVLAMGASFLDTFVLTNEGLFGVGDNTSSQLMIAPDVEEVHAFTALAPPSDAGVAKLFTGCGYSVGQCYVTAADQAYCWGDNDHGQVGAQRTALTPVVVTPEPVDIPSGRTVRSISIGSGQTCAVTDDGAVYCWGENDRGESGSAVLGDIHTPLRVAGVAGATQVAAGRAAFTCALTEDAKTLCWGDNSFAQLGSPPPVGGGWSASPAEVHLDW